MKTAARMTTNMIDTIITISMGINQDSMIVLVEFMVVEKNEEMKKGTVEINIMLTSHLRKNSCAR
jgi:hypothetical protein